MRIFHNWGFKLAALLIAGALWATAQGFRSVEQSIDLPIVLEDVPEEVVVVDQSAREVNVRIAGSRAALRRAEKQMVRYEISLEGIGVGEARFSVDVERLAIPRGATISARSPSTVVLRTEPRVEKRVPVRVDLVGEPPEGFRVEAVRVNPSQVLLQGARAEMRRIREVLTDRVDVSELRETEEFEVRLVLGESHVWRADDGPGVTVEVEIAAPKDGVRFPAGPGPPGRS